MDPKNCQFQSSTCGNYLPRRERIGFVQLKELTRDVRYLFNADVEISESYLICLRSPVPLHPNGLICGFHQFSMGIYYRPSKHCKCYLHGKEQQGNGLKVSWEMYKLVLERDHSFLLGSFICKNCQLKLKQLKIEWEDSIDECKDKSYHCPVVANN